MLAGGDEGVLVARAVDDDDAEVSAQGEGAKGDDDRVTLNVGGVRYETSLATLTRVPGSMLATMFGPRRDMVQRDPVDGSVFIGRDGGRFRLVLDFLRDGDAGRCVAALKGGLSPDEAEAVLEELDFFGLVGAVFPTPWFDENNAAFANGPEMGRRRFFGAAVRRGRRAVVFGGVNSAPLASAEVLDLDAMTFAPVEASTMAIGRSSVAAALLGDGRRALVVGGFHRVLGYLRTTEVFDFETMAFAAGPSMLAQRDGCAAVALDARRVLVAGGSNVRYLKTTEIFDVATMTFAQGPDMLSPRYGCAAVALDAHRILIVGGRAGADETLETTEVLDIRSMAFSPGPSMRSKRIFCAAAPLDKRHRIVVGGATEERTPVRTTEILDLDLMEFRDGPDLNADRKGIAAILDGDRLIVLGNSTATSTSSTEVLSRHSAAAPNKRVLAHDSPPGPSLLLATPAKEDKEDEEDHPFALNKRLGTNERQRGPLWSCRGESNGG